MEEVAILLQTTVVAYAACTETNLLDIVFMPVPLFNARNRRYGVRMCVLCVRMHVSAIERKREREREGGRVSE